MRNPVLSLILCLYLCYSMAPLTAYSQEKYYMLDGYVTLETGKVYKYQLAFKENNNAIHGYSLTWLEDNYPSKASVTGRIDKANKTLTFSEHDDENMLMLKQKNMCYFNGTLAYKQSGKEFLLAGDYTGLNEYGQFCGNGEINLSHKAEDDTLLTVKPRAKKRVNEQPEVVEKALDVEIITAGSNKELEWLSDSCFLDMWDYGNIDGDIISVFFNGKNMLSKYEITATKKQLRFPVRYGVNTIRILAENEGTAPPNTARLLLTDGKKQYSFTAYNTEGNSAQIVLKRSR